MIRKHSVAYSAPGVRQALGCHLFASSACFLSGCILRVVEIRATLIFGVISECQFVVARLFGQLVIWVIQCIRDIDFW